MWKAAHIWLPVLLVGCGSPAWREAQAIHTPDAYEAYALHNPRDAHAGAAMARAERLRWEVARQEDSAEAWTRYLRAHGDSPRADEAREALERNAFEEAMASLDPLALDRYLSRFPNGANAAAVRDQIDRVAWEDARKEDTAQSYQRYLLRLPNGLHAERADQLHVQRLYERALRVDTVHSWRRFLESSSESEHAEAARTRLDELTFRQVRVVVALTESWMTDRAKALEDLKQAIAVQIPDTLEVLGFELIEVTSADLLGSDGAALPRASGEGLVVVEVSEAKGEAYEPSGNATDITARLRVFVEDKDFDIAHWELSATTTGTILAQDERGLHRAAAEDLALRVVGKLPQMREMHPDPM